MYLCPNIGADFRHKPRSSLGWHTESGEIMAWCEWKEEILQVSWQQLLICSWLVLAYMAVLLFETLVLGWWGQCKFPSVRRKIVAMLMASTFIWFLLLLLDTFCCRVCMETSIGKGMIAGYYQYQYISISVLRYW